MKLFITIIVTILNFVGFLTATCSIGLSIFGLANSSDLNGVKLGGYGVVLSVFAFLVSYFILTWSANSYTLKNSGKIKFTLLLIFLVGIFSLGIGLYLPIQFLGWSRLIYSHQPTESIFPIVTVQISVTLVCLWCSMSGWKKSNTDI
ncbi:hypothetical protein [Neisseria sp. Ec49-e6-T10]|uniref:hypothetical protein n=1 Tax=Neisseria sp. Ec49-e6-T10 TaxID=3140744 RepID=UPI003EB75D5F